MKLRHFSPLVIPHMSAKVVPFFANIRYGPG